MNDMTDFNFINPNKQQPRWDKVKYVFSFPVIGNINLGNGTLYTIVTFKAANKFYLGIERVGSFLFYLPGAKSDPYHPNYVSEKLNLCLSDAANLADWMNTQVDMKSEEFGRYVDFEGFPEDFVNELVLIGDKNER